MRLSGRTSTKHGPLRISEPNHGNSNIFFGPLPAAVRTLFPLIDQRRTFPPLYQSFRFQPGTTRMIHLSTPCLTAIYFGPVSDIRL